MLPPCPLGLVNEMTLVGGKIQILSTQGRCGILCSVVFEHYPNSIISKYIGREDYMYMVP